MILSGNLEELSLCALVNGHLDPKLVRKDELSRQGQQVLDGVLKLLKHNRPPFSMKSVMVAATDVAGGDPDVLRPYLAKIYDTTDKGTDANGLLASIREKQTLTDIINIASTQLAKSAFNRQQFLSKLDSVTAGEAFQPVASYFQTDEKYEMPEGSTISLKQLQRASHGVYGFWVMSGDAGAGKTTLALELATMVQQERPVLYYDYENGVPVLLAHLEAAFEGDRKRLRQATKQLYFRDSVYTLDADLAVFNQPCFIVVDSVQKINVKGDDRRSGIDKWVHHLEGLKKQGHSVLGISEKNRSFYGRTGLGGLKETGELEYAADLVMELIPVEGSAVVEVHFSKNRNWPNLGYITTLVRENSWWFIEHGGMGETVWQKAKEKADQTGKKAYQRPKARS